MRKRAQDAETDHVITKRQKIERVDRFATLNDELLLRILSHLPLTALNTCQCVSQRFYNLAGDSQLWKSLYYDCWVRPRISKLPRHNDSNSTSRDGSTDLSYKVKKWLGDEKLIKRGRRTDWKQQYKTRYRWSKGKCYLNEIEIAEEALVPPLLVRLHEGIIFTADSVQGLRAWSAKKDKRPLANEVLNNYGRPTSLSIDVESCGKGEHCICLGFENGSFGLFQLDLFKKNFRCLHIHGPSSNGPVTAVALSSPYLLTMTANHLLSLYRLETQKGQERSTCPRLLHSLKSQTVKSPFSLTIRAFAQTLIASVAYVLPRYLTGWTVGIQELIIAPNGDFLESRLSSAADTSLHSQPSQRSASSLQIPTSLHNNLCWQSRMTSSGQIFGKPTSISYSHPYLLLAHSDNTLTLYHVKSTGADLSIGRGMRLWGHTSSISSAHVGGRGKAVSVSIKGQEVRVWELEGRGFREGSKSSHNYVNKSIQVCPELQSEPDEASAPSKDSSNTPSKQHMCQSERSGYVDASGAWIGFDEEKVVVLKERREGSQKLIIYDFT